MVLKWLLKINFQLWFRFFDNKILMILTLVQKHLTKMIEIVFINQMIHFMQNNSEI